MRTSRFVRRIGTLAVGLALCASAVTAQENALNDSMRRALAKKYSGQRVVKACNGKFLGKAQEAAVALHDAREHKFRLAWVGNAGVQELESVPEFGAVNQFDLKCLAPTEAKEMKDTLTHSEAIRDFLHVPAGKGALCYFVEQTEARCWSVDAKGVLIDAGGWQT